MDGTVRMNPADEEYLMDAGELPATVMDDLRADLAEKVDEEVYEAQTPMRSKFIMIYRTNIEFDDLKLWTKRARESKQKDAPVDMRKMSVLVLLNTCVGMKYNVGTEERPVWREMVIDGRPLTFTHPKLQEMMGTMEGAYGAVKKMYVKDGHIMMVAQVVTAKAGYTDLDFDADNDPLGG